MDSDHNQKILAGLPPAFRSALLSMYDGEEQLGSDGKRHVIKPNVRISPEQGMWLYEYCRETTPKNMLEIGLAYGYSTVYFLAALHENGTGHHTAVDPGQLSSDWWHGIGVTHARTLGMTDRFQFLPERSVPALVDFANREQTFEFIFIDGNHRFDDALVDFTLSAPLCPVGGCIALDDMWMPSIRQAVAFIRSNRTDFEEIKTPVANLAAFRRIGEDKRQWDQHTDFIQCHQRHLPAILQPKQKTGA